MLLWKSITRSVNNTARIVTKQFSGQPNITSHNFRIGYISQFWHDVKNIEFVKQAVDYIKAEFTSAYVKNLSYQEIQQQMLRIHTWK